MDLIKSDKRSGILCHHFGMLSEKTCSDSDLFNPECGHWAWKTQSITRIGIKGVGGLVMIHPRIGRVATWGGTLARILYRSSSCSSQGRTKVVRRLTKRSDSVDF